jgi:hypothetical protein
MNRVLEERRRDKVKKLVDNLKQEANIEVDRNHLIEKAEQEPPASGSLGKDGTQ